MTTTRRLSSILLGLLTVGFLVPSLPASAAVTYEIHHVATVDGATIRVEIRRETNFDAAKQPVILTYSPYNNLNGAQPANSSIAMRYNPRGIAFASADLLGTRGSTGCWDYGGLKEQQSGVDVVKFLAGKKANTEGEFLTWSNGNVGMTGGSYNGTTATMVAATGLPAL
ncbi:MAG: CocE/NonD family hydrolase, partial [Actinomycetota bacterium]|nr:CocE/NonD family hydrolase [Actinomycetota bacterium]